MALSIEQILACKRLEKIGAQTLKRLCEQVENERISGAVELLDLITHVTKREYTLDNIQLALRAADDIVTKSEKAGIYVIGYRDELFPKNLWGIKDENGKNCSPLIIHVKGDMEALKTKYGIAIIGTRNPTTNGEKAGKYAAEKFAEKGFNIVSGLAIGCDTVAHKAAIEAKGVTTAFLAHGLDMPIYPKDNVALAKKIIDSGGLLISEYEIGVPLTKWNLVARDMLQSGMSDATLVIQTGVKGGTMHAANATIFNNKPLYVINYNEGKDDPEANKIDGNEYLLNEKGAEPLSSNNIENTIMSIKNKKTNRISTIQTNFNF